MTTVTIACKLPLGLLIGTGGKTVMLKGAGASDQGVGLTEVDAQLARAWLHEYARFGPVKEGLIGIAPQEGQAQTTPAPPTKPRKGGAGKQGTRK